MPAAAASHRPPPLRGAASGAAEIAPGIRCMRGLHLALKDHKRVACRAQPVGAHNVWGGQKVPQPPVVVGPVRVAPRAAVPRLHRQEPPAALVRAGREAE
eukprot:CAMPEP_0181353982 /NCGR_PEP_ID=MMETSP1106-20121128/3118_1 /TAXON_ID=81844 /ORGANISM="Mantoniella antarctica, Strain SL-175" /LENGTH=99 /DNA_ID=CAMNT_0023466615 /DNA_START=176 /DNA_END=476 /DNA_ORIENTATION=+